MQGRSGGLSLANPVHCHERDPYPQSPLASWASTLDHAYRLPSGQADDPRRFPRSARGSPTRQTDTGGQGDRPPSPSFVPNGWSRNRSPDPGVSAKHRDWDRQVISMSRGTAEFVLGTFLPLSVLRRHPQTSQARQSCLAICSHPSSPWVCNAAHDEPGFVSSSLGLLRP